MNSRLWVVSELYYPEETSTGYFLTKIAEGLAGTFDVHVLCSQPTYSARGKRAAASERRNGVQIERCRGTTLNKDRLILRAVNLTSISFSIFLRAFRRFTARDAVLVVTNPPTLPFLIAVACLLRRSRMALLIHDVYPEVLIAAGMLSPGSVGARVIGRLSKWLYNRADRIVVLGRDMEQIVLRKSARFGPKVFVIPNWADTDVIQPKLRAATTLAHTLRLENKIIVQYSGNMGRTHDLETILETAAMLKERDEIHFLLIGWGAKRRWLETEVARRALSNVTLLRNRQREELPDSLNACDVGIIAFISGMAGVSVPSRMYNIMAAGKPIIALSDSESELAIVLREEQIGWVVSPGDSDGLARVILDGGMQVSLLEEMGKRARIVAEKKYTLGNALQSYQELLTRLLGSNQ